MCYNARNSRKETQRKESLGIWVWLGAVLEAMGAADILADHLVSELGGLWVLALVPTCSHTMVGAVQSRD